MKTTAAGAHSYVYMPRSLSVACDIWHPTERYCQTQSCVPNNYAIPALAPAYIEDICPHWAERWEIRTRPLGCYVSTVTTLTCIISVVSTLGVLLLLYLTVLLVRRLRALHKRNPAWWKIWLNGCRVWMTRLKTRTRAGRRASGTGEEEAALLAP
jgi:hypothetical protein